MAGFINSARLQALTTPIPGGLEMWYRADSATDDGGGFASAWNDQSGNGRNLSQGTGANRPAIIASVLHGQTVLRFDGSNDRLSRTVTPTIAQPWTAVVVAKCRVQAGGSGGSLVDSGGGGSKMIFTSGTSGEHLRWNPGASLDLEGEAGQWAIYEFQVNNTASKVYINNALSQDNLAFSTPSLVGLVVGLDGGGSNPFFGDIAEVMIYSKVLSAGDRSSNAAYFFARYALPVDYTQGLTPPTGTMFWYIADSAINDGSNNVVSLPDASGFSRNASTQEDATRPTINAADLNGHATLTFATNQNLKHSIGPTISQPFTFIAVANMEGANGTIIGQDVGADSFGFGFRSGSNFLRAGTSIFGSKSLDSSWHIQCAIANGADSALFFDGVSDTTGDAGSNNFGGCRLGLDSSGGNSLNSAKLAEAMIVQGIINPLQMNYLTDYWREKYNLTAANATPYRIIIESTALGNQWTVPPSWNNAAYELTAIGAGGGGVTPASNAAGGAGGGGGAVAVQTSGLTLNPNDSLFFHIGLGGGPGVDGGDTWINTTNVAPVSNTTGALAKGGVKGVGTTGGAGGASGSSIGQTTHSGATGGAGGNTTNGGGGGGGGASGRNNFLAGTGGAGAANNPGGGGGGGAADVANTGTAGSTDQGGAGAASRVGGGGGAAGAPNGGSAAANKGGGGGGGDGGTGAAGGNAGNGGMDFNSSGGGGGGGGGSTTATAGAGGHGGDHGGGGGGGGAGFAGQGTGGTGGNGAVMITWTPAPPAIGGSNRRWYFMCDVGSTGGGGSSSPETGGPGGLYGSYNSNSSLYPWGGYL